MKSKGQRIILLSNLFICSAVSLPTLLSSVSYGQKKRLLLIKREFILFCGLLCKTIFLTTKLWLFFQNCFFDHRLEPILIFKLLLQYIQVGWYEVILQK